MAMVRLRKPVSCGCRAAWVGRVKARQAAAVVAVRSRRREGKNRIPAAYCTGCMGVSAFARWGLALIV